jgi:hypothetical protein
MNALLNIALNDCVIRFNDIESDDNVTMTICEFVEMNEVSAVEALRMTSELLSDKRTTFDHAMFETLVVHLESIAYRVNDEYENVAV